MPLGDARVMGLDVAGNWRHSIHPADLDSLGNKQEMKSQRNKGDTNMNKLNNLWPGYNYA